MIVTRRDFSEAIKKLQAEKELGLDTETYGLRMFHGDDFFSIIISTIEEAYYFNFNPLNYSHEIDKDGKIIEICLPTPEEFLLTENHADALRVDLLSDPNKIWYIQNAANFDLCVLSESPHGIDLAGEVHCTKAIGRVEYNDYYGAKAYSLDAQLKRLGRSKDDKVKAYIDKYRLWTEVPIPGKNDVDRRLHFDKVPLDLIVPYGCQDARETIFLGRWQRESIRKKDLEQPLIYPKRSLKSVMDNENRLQKTIHRMKSVGVQVDLDYCKRALAYENDRQEKAKAEFKKLSGKEYKSSGKLFSEIFASEKDKWEYTEKNNPSFESDVLRKFNNDLARSILTLRDAKSKADFYNGFFYFADSRGVIHPNYNPEGAIHGRFSSSEPNFQNLTSEEEEEDLKQEFLVRRAIIPRSGYTLIMPDYSQMEYKFMLELACIIQGRETELAKLVNSGFDFHEATSQNAAKFGSKVVRKQAKVANFLTLYGGGPKKLAEALGITLLEAQNIRQAIFKSAPEILALINNTMETAEKRGYVINWLGRRSYFSSVSFSYRAPNYIVSGGCADVVKKAMNEIDEYLLNKKSRMIMTVHDEIPIEVHESEINEVPKTILEIMQNAFISQYVPLDSSMEWSNKSLGDKTKGFPV